MADTPDFVDVGDVDREALRGKAAVAAGGANRDVVAGGRLVVQRTVDRDHTRVGVDGEQPAGIIVQACR